MFRFRISPARRKEINDNMFRVIEFFTAFVIPMFTILFAPAIGVLLYGGHPLLALCALVGSATAVLLFLFSSGVFDSEE